MGKAEETVTSNEFYSRQTVLKELGAKGQKTLAKSRVAIVGLGGLGTVSSLYLALAGVGHIRLIDQDVVEQRNLHRQILYTPENLGYPKVEIAAKRLKKRNPLITVEPIPENLNAANAERLLSRMDCVVDGLDNMKTRYAVNRACAKLHIPYVFGAAIGIEGNLSVFSPPETPCLECVFPAVDDSKLLTCGTRGVLGATPGVIGAMQAIETIKTLTRMNSPLKGKLLICDFSDMYFATVDVSKRRNCPACKGATVASEKGEKLVWLCGQDTANINPAEPLDLTLNQAYHAIERQFRVRMKSQLAIMFDYDGIKISLFRGGRMLIRNVHDEKTAKRVYMDVMEKLGAS